MAGRIRTRLKELGIELPPSPPPNANYIPFVISNNYIFVAGQVPSKDGEFKFVGRVGEDMDLDGGYQAARLCGINLISQVLAAVEGDLERVKRVVKLTGFVNCTADFTDQPKVINGASDLMVDVFGPTGRHARAAVGCSSLPFGVAVEVDGVFEIG